MTGNTKHGISNAVLSPERFGKVAVLYGGTSVEREISLMSGHAVFEALKSAGVDVIAIDVGDDIVERLLRTRVDRVFNVLHGPGGEDGNIPGLLELLKIPYTGSGVLASALAMDKIRSKLIWRGIHLPVLPFVIVEPGMDVAMKARELGYPICVKPIYQGSSLGVRCVQDPHDLADAIAASAVYGPLMLEPWTTGEECTVAVLGSEALPVIRIEAQTEFYDFNAKYYSDETVYHCPSGLPASDEKLMQRLSLEAFKAVGACGWGRADFIYEKPGKVWLLEINTVPGMTSHSLVPMAAKVHGLSMSDLCIRILAASLNSQTTENLSLESEDSAECFKPQQAAG